MIQNELLAHWIYRHGELARLRLAEKMGMIAVITGLVIAACILLALVLWDAVFFKKAAIWLIVVVLLPVMGVVYYTLRLFPGILFSIFKKIVPVKKEEILITSVKIITETQSWVLHDETRVLTSVEYDSAAKPTELVFAGKEIVQHNTSRRFVVRLPLPPEEYANVEKVYKYFKQLLQAEAMPQPVSG